MDQLDKEMLKVFEETTRRATNTSIVVQTLISFILCFRDARPSDLMHGNSDRSLHSGADRKLV
jgi:hypothetical protein